MPYDDYGNYSKKGIYHDPEDAPLYCASFPRVMPVSIWVVVAFFGIIGLMMIF